MVNAWGHICTIPLHLVFKPHNGYEVKKQAWGAIVRRRCTSHYYEGIAGYREQERESWLSGEEKHCGRSKERRNFLTHCLLLPVWDIIMDKELFIPREREVSCTHELKAHFSAQSALWCRHSAASSIFRTLLSPLCFYSPTPFSSWGFCFFAYFVVPRTLLTKIF